jgi:hypothetical protein
VSGVAGLLELVGNERPPQIDVVGIHDREVLAVVDGQAAGQEGAARRRAVEMHQVILQLHPRAGQRGEVAAHCFHLGVVEADIVPAHVVLQHEQDVRAAVPRRRWRRRRRRRRRRRWRSRRRRRWRFCGQEPRNARAAVDAGGGVERLGALGAAIALVEGPRRAVGDLRAEAAAHGRIVRLRRLQIVVRMQPNAIEERAARCAQRACT